MNIVFCNKDKLIQMVSKYETEISIFIRIIDNMFYISHGTIRNDYLYLNEDSTPHDNISIDGKLGIVTDGIMILSDGEVTTE